MRTFRSLAHFRTAVSGLPPSSPPGLVAATAPTPVLAADRPGPPRHFPEVLDLPDGFQPEGLAIGAGPTARFGSRVDGDIYEIKLRTGKARIISQGPRRRITLGGPEARPARPALRGRGQHRHRPRRGHRDRRHPGVLPADDGHELHTPPTPTRPYTVTQVPAG